MEESYHYRAVGKHRIVQHELGTVFLDFGNKVDSKWLIMNVLSKLTKWGNGQAGVGDLKAAERVQS